MGSLYGDLAKRSLIETLYRDWVKGTEILLRDLVQRDCAENGFGRFCCQCSDLEKKYEQL